MQNIDYKHNRSIRKTFRELMTIDKHKALYRGLVPFTLGCTNLQLWSQYRLPEHHDRPLFWPLYFAMGVLTSHPLILASMRVQCAPVTTHRNREVPNAKKMLDLIMKKEGYRGVYRGLLPSTLLYSIMCYVELEEFLLTFKEEVVYGFNERWKKK